MAKKNLGRGPSNLKIGNDSWGIDLRSDVRDVTNTLITNGYFTGEHTIFADRAPTAADVSVLLNETTINFEPRKWRWVNTTNNELYSFKEPVQNTLIIPNSGRVGTTDWINPTDGFADGWSNGSSSGIGSIVTGNGFTGNAQRAEAVPATYSFSLNTYPAGLPDKGTLILKYRSNFNVWIDTHGGFLNDPEIILSPNTGDAIEVSEPYESPVTAAALIFRGDVSPVVGTEWLEIDELRVVYTEAAWEKIGDASNLTFEGVDDGSILIVDGDNVKAVSTTSGFVYIDGSRIDDYTPNGSHLFPYKSLKECIDDGRNNCTVIINEGVYDAGETLTIPDSMNLLGLSYDTTIIAADVTFTNSTGDGQGCTYIRFSGNVSQVSTGYVIYRRCWFIGTGKDIVLNGSRVVIDGCSFNSDLNSVDISSANLYGTNSRFLGDFTVSAGEFILTDTNVYETLFHTGGNLILSSVNFRKTTGNCLESSVSGNVATPNLLTSIVFASNIVLNNCITVFHGYLATNSATISGNAMVTNMLTGDNTVPYTPTNDFHPATRKFVLDNAGGDADAFISTVDNYYSHYVANNKLVYDVNGESIFSISNTTTVVPIVTSTDQATAKSQLISEGWDIVAEKWSISTSYIDGDQVLYNDVIYTSNGINLPAAFSSQSWDKDVVTVDGYEYYTAISAYIPGSQVKFYYNIFENNTIGSIVPTVTSSDAADMITEGWTLVKNSITNPSKTKVLTADGEWKGTVSDRVVIDGGVSPVESFLNFLPTVLVDRDPTITDVTVKVGPDEEIRDIKYGWKWVNTSTDVTWECRGLTYNGSSWEGKWLRQEVSEVTESSTLDLYVSTTGDDTTGDGTVGSPYNTLLRTFQSLPRTLSNVAISINMGSGVFTFGDIEKRALGDRYYSSCSIVLAGTMVVIEDDVVFVENTYATMEYTATKAGVTVTANEWQKYYVDDGGKYYPIGNNAAGSDNFNTTFLRLGRSKTMDVVDNATTLDITATSDDNILELNFPGLSVVEFTALRFNRGITESIKLTKLKTYTEFDFGCKFYAEDVLLGDYNDQIVNAVGFVGCVFDCYSAFFAINSRDAVGSYGFTRCLIVNSAGNASDRAAVSIGKNSVGKFRETYIVGTGVANGIAVAKGAKALLSKTTIFENVASISTTNLGFGSILYDNSESPGSWVITKGVQYLHDAATEGTEFSLNYLTTDGSYVGALRTGKTLIDVNQNIRILAPGLFPEVSAETLHTIADAGTDYVVVGSVSQNTFVRINFTLKRGTLTETGSVIITNQADVEIDYVSQGEDTGIVFSKEISSDEIRLGYTDPLANGTATTMNIRIEREMV